MGDLLTFLRSYKNTFTMRNKISLSFQVAAGMEHLHAEGVLHRDLAARNLLLHIDASGYVVKVSDFGLSKKGSVYSSINGFGPLKWMAPESLNPKKKIFTPKSDVWSFGVVLWEVLTNGRIPWEGFDPMEAAWKILNGEKLQIQFEIPDKLRQALYSCWEHDTNIRPAFKQLSLELLALLNTIRPTLADQPDVSALNSVREEPPADEGAIKSMNRDLPPLPPGSYSAPTTPVTVTSPSEEKTIYTTRSLTRGTMPSHLQVNPQSSSNNVSLLKTTQPQNGKIGNIPSGGNTNSRSTGDDPVSSSSPLPPTGPKPLPPPERKGTAVNYRRLPAATISSGTRSDYLAVPPKKPIPQIPTEFDRPLPPIDTNNNQSESSAAPKVSDGFSNRASLTASCGNGEAEHWTSFSKNTKQGSVPRIGRSGGLIGNRSSSANMEQYSLTRSNSSPISASTTSPIKEVNTGASIHSVDGGTTGSNSSPSTPITSGYSQSASAVPTSRSARQTKAGGSLRGPSESYRGVSPTAGSAATIREAKIVKKIGTQWKNIRYSMKPGATSSLDVVTSALSGTNTSPAPAGNTSMTRPEFTDKLLATFLHLSKIYLGQLSYLARTYFENPIFIHLLGGNSYASVIFSNMSMFLPVANLLISQLSVLLDIRAKSASKFFMKSIAVLMCYGDYAENLNNAKTFWNEKKEETAVKKWIEKMKEEKAEPDDVIDLETWLDRPIDHLVKEYGVTVERIWENCGAVNSVYKGKAWEKECDEMREEHWECERELKSTIVKGLSNTTELEETQEETKPEKNEQTNV